MRAQLADGAVLAAKFQNILANILCRYPCYKSLHTFVGFFDRLKAVAGKGDEESFQIQSVRKIAMKKELKR